MPGSPHAQRTQRVEHRGDRGVCKLSGRCLSATGHARLGQHNVRQCDGAFLGRDEHDSYAGTQSDDGDDRQMVIEDSFEVAASPDAVFAYLLDVEKVVPCMPGAELVDPTLEDGYLLLVGPGR